MVWAKLYTLPPKKTVTNMPRVRTYAPVGSYDDLLAYLVRRLLENGANSSFINRFLDAQVPAKQVVEDPVQITQSQNISHAPRNISTPANSTMNV